MRKAQTNKQTNKQTESPTSSRCEQAVRLLKENIADIPNVKSWARQPGVSREWLYKNMKKMHGEPPKMRVRNVRYKKVIQLIKRYGPEAASYRVAVEAGLRDASALSKFLSLYCNTNFTRLKEEIFKNGRM